MEMLPVHCNTEKLSTEGFFVRALLSFCLSLLSLLSLFLLVHASSCFKVSLFFLGFHFSGRRVVRHGGGVDQVLVGSKNGAWRRQRDELCLARKVSSLRPCQITSLHLG